MICDSSRSVVPRAMSERIKRSKETEGTPASILATRDWLDSSFAARSSCDKPFCFRLCLRPSANLIFNSMYAASSFDRPKNSLTVPTFHPFASKRICFRLRIVIILYSSLAGVHDRLWRRSAFLTENLQNNDRVRIDSVDDPPSRLVVFNP